MTKRHNGNELKQLNEPLAKALSRYGMAIHTDQTQSKIRQLQTKTAGGFQAAKETWLKTIASYPNLSGADVAVAMVISTYLNSKTSEAWPSIELLAKDTNRNRVTVWRSIERLIELQLLQVAKGRGRHKSNRYRPLFGSINCNPKTLRRRNNNSASWQPKHCELTERTLEEP